MVHIKKKMLRKEVLEKLHNVSQEDRRRNVKALKDKLFSLKQFKEAKCVMFYVSKHYEVDTHEMIDATIAMGKKVVVPITLKEEKTLRPSELKDREKELIKGHYGIHQPGEEHIRIVPIEEVDVMVVPALAFDKDGHRLGHGGGYYDRFLEKAPSKIYTVGLAFGFQVVEELPRHQTDIPVDKVLIS
ncbi:MAG: 5-formyltetrahydrofolate cyclo-ligase [Candidatus Omnitrophica bacterium]|nr:5-formyltetrahydrofolate cyclo-ligase [Candidatus Omnitrophota bacterium]